MYVACVTNLDLLSCEIWPDELPALPHVGDLIESSYTWSKGRRLELAVCRIVWKESIVLKQPNGKKIWYPKIELTVPTRFENLTHFYTWYGEITEKGKSYFI